MKHTHNNPATNFAMLLMALAMAFTISCESKEEKVAKADVAEADAAREAKREAEKAAEAAEAARKAEQLATEERAAREAAAEEARYRELEARMAEECPDKTGPLKTAEVTFLEEYEDHEGRSASIFRLANGDEIHLLGDVKDMKKGDKAFIKYKEIQQPFAEACWNYNSLESVEILPK